MGAFWPRASVVIYDDRLTARGLFRREEYFPASTELRKGLASSLVFEDGGPILRINLLVADIRLEEALVRAGFELPPGYLIFKSRD